MVTAGSIERQKGDLAPGTRIGRYLIDEPVGRGGMGVVYRAFDETTNRNVALKLLSEGIPPALRARFLAECEAEANIRHEHVMPVYDRGWFTEDQPYFVMELLYEPITLSELLQQIQDGTLAAKHPRLRHWADLRRRLADIVLPVCEGVHVANAEYEIQHRDLKPDNVLIDIRTRRAYLIDFGICRHMDEKSDGTKIVGTPRFLSPEQASARVDPRTDVWGLGALIHHTITGEPPIEGTSPFTRSEVTNRVEALNRAETEARAAGEEAKARGFARRRAQLEDPALRVQEDLLRDAREGRYLPLPEGTSPGLAALVHKAMAKESSKRYDTAGDLARDLNTWLKGGSVQALAEVGTGSALVDFARRLLNRNVVRVAGALIALLIGFLLGTGLFSQTPPRPDFRFLDAAVDLERLAAEYGTVQAQAAEAPETRLDPLGCALEHRRLDASHAQIEERLKAYEEADIEPAIRNDVRLKSERLAQRLFHVQLTLRGRPAAAWWLEEIFGSARNIQARAGSLEAPPGVYVLTSAPEDGLRIRLALSGNAAIRERTVTVGARPGTVPPGLTWVPAGPVPMEDDELDMPPFLAATELVTNERFSEWLDELTPAERNASVPPTGFQRDARDSSRWLVAPDMGNKPVLGVSPRDARAYAGWRSDVEGLPLSLPTERHWMRMAAIDQLEVPGAHLLFPGHGALPWRVQHRAGRRFPPLRYRQVLPGESPYGVGQIYTAPGELVLRAEGEGFVVKGAGGVLPVRSALRRSTPIGIDDQGHGQGFRLVHVPR